MKLSIEHQAGFRFGASLLLLVAIGAIAYRSMNRLIINTTAVARTHHVLTLLEGVLGHLTDAESGQRGFMLTGDEEFISSYQSAIDAMGREMAALRALSAAAPSQQRRLDALGPLLATRTALLRENIDLRRRQGFGPAVARVRSSLGKVAMDRIRLLIEEMEAEEDLLLKERTAREQASIRATPVIVLFGLALALLLLLLAWLSMRRELSRRRQAEEDATRAKELAEAADRSKSQFLARMSHELRTPLNSVIGFANVLLKNSARSLRPQELSYLQRISANGLHLLALINDVLDLSKVEAGRVELKPSVVHAGVMIREVLSQFEVQAHERGVRLQAELPEGASPLETDGGKLKQVLINLVGNAVKFTAEGSVTVALIADAAGRPVSLQVTDTGIGIAPERQQAIFEPFTQADSGTARKYGGTGLGLSISRSLCQLMGYRIEMSSQLGQGSTFRIVLGAGQHPERENSVSAGFPIPPAAGQEEGEAPRPGRNRKLVLAIDDDADARTLLSRYTEDLGYSIVTAASGGQGLRLARELEPGLILLDLLMPRTNGWEVLHRLKVDPVLRAIPIVVVSIVAGENRGTVFDVVELIDKPISRDHLSRVLQRTLGAPGSAGPSASLPRPAGGASSPSGST